ncbi:MAG: hypothetical protein ABI858_04845 [Pseudoxanthomonas sp.]
MSIEILPGQSEMLTVSLGFAPFPFFVQANGSVPQKWDYAMRMADRALYAAKDRRDAWTGFWGGPMPSGYSLDEILDQPDAAVRAGDIEVVASYPLPSHG